MIHKFIISFFVAIILHPLCASQGDVLSAAPNNVGNRVVSQMELQQHEFMNLVERGDARSVAKWLNSGWNPNYQIPVDSSPITPLEVAITYGHARVIDTLLRISGRRYPAIVSLDAVRKTEFMVTNSKPGKEKRKSLNILSRVLKACREEPTILSNHRCISRKRQIDGCLFMDKVLCLYAKYGLPGFNPLAKALRDLPYLKHKCLCHAAESRRSLSIASELSAQYPESVLSEDASGMSPVRVASLHGNRSALDIFEQYVGKKEIFQHLEVKENGDCESTTPQTTTPAQEVRQ